MSFRLSRIVIYLLGILMMLGIYFSIQYNTYTKSLFTHGVVVYTPSTEIGPDGLIPMKLHYYVDMKEYEVPVEIPFEMANRAVSVRYFPEKPHNGKIYDFNEFWLISLFWLVLPLMLWTAFLFTVMTPSGKIAVKIEKKGKTPPPDQPEDTPSE